MKFLKDALIALSITCNQKFSNQRAFFVSFLSRHWSEDLKYFSFFDFLGLHTVSHASWAPADVHLYLIW